MITAASFIQDKEDLSLEELVAAADELLAAVAPTQTRWKVQERPDARTVRYYVTRGLLPKPHSYDGGRARYGTSHLLRLVLIKFLQAEHLSLEQVARVLDGASDDDVIARLGGAVPSPSSPSSPSTPSPSTPLPSLSPSPSPSPALAGPLVLDLAPGGRVVVPRAAVATAADRAVLADNLERLAQWLRAIDPPERDDTASSSVSSPTSPTSFTKESA